MGGEVEVDESYFGARRIRGKRGRGTKGKIPVVGLLKGGGKVYTRVIFNRQRKNLLPIIKGKVLEEITIFTNGWRSYDSRFLTATAITLSIIINGIESFWSYT